MDKRLVIRTIDENKQNEANVRTMKMYLKAIGVDEIQVFMHTPQ